MHATIHGERTLTELDFSRLSKLFDGAPPPALADLLATTEVVPSREVPPKVVTMYSQVEVVDLQTRQPQKFTICFPRDAEPAEGFISVVSPVGLALLGLKEGAIARWTTPNGAPCEAELVSILFQPEASGDYLT